MTAAGEAEPPRPADTDRRGGAPDPPSPADRSDPPTSPEGQEAASRAPSGAEGEAGEPEVLIAWEAEERPLDEAGVRRAVGAALEHGGRGGLSLSVLLTGDERIAALHGEWLGDPTPTDVLAFDLGEEGVGPAGELVVSVERAREVAAERGVPVARELALYLVHGALHLCGFDDHEVEERARMRRAENVVLASLGYADDPLPHDRD